MTLQGQREYIALRAHIEVCIADYSDEILMTLLTRQITPELSDMIIDELKTRAQRITDAVAGVQDDIPVGIPQMQETVNMMHDLFKPFNSK
jgi:hypothetical protein